MIVKNKCRITGHNSRFMMNMILLDSLYVKLINTIITTSKGLSTARHVQLFKFRFMNNFSKLLFCILCFRMFVLIQIMQTRLQRTNFAVGNHEYKRWKEIIEVFFWYYICVVRLLQKRRKGKTMSRVVASYVNFIQKENAHDSRNKNMAFVGMNFK